MPTDSNAPDPNCAHKHIDLIGGSGWCSPTGWVFYDIFGCRDCDWTFELEAEA